MEDPQDTATPKCDGHCHCEHVEILRGSPPNNHMVGMDWVITQIEKLEEDLCATIDDGTEFLKTVEEIRNGVAKYEGEVTRLVQHQQEIIDGLMEAMDGIEKRLVQVEGWGMTRPSSTPRREPEHEPERERDHVERGLSQAQPASHRPMEPPYGAPKVNPRELPYIPSFSMNTMLGNQSPEKGSGIGLPSRSKTIVIEEEPRAMPQASGDSFVPMGGENPSDGQLGPWRMMPEQAYQERVNEAQAAHSERRAQTMPTGTGLGDGNGGNWVLNPAAGIWSIGGNSQAQESAGVSSGFVRRAVTALESSTAPTVDIRGIYGNAHGSAVSGVRLGGVVAADAGEAVRIEDLRGVRVPFYNGTPETLEDFLLDWEDFADEVMGSASQAQRDSWALRTFPHRLHADLKADLRDKIRSGQVHGEVECVDWLEDEESVDVLNQKMDDLWNIPLELERGELRLGAWRNYLRKYRRKLRMVEDWNESAEIRHLLKDVLPNYWKKKVEDEEKRRAKKRVAVKIMYGPQYHDLLVPEPLVHLPQTFPKVATGPGAGAVAALPRSSSATSRPAPNVPTVGAVAALLGSSSDGRHVPPRLDVAAGA